MNKKKFATMTAAVALVGAIGVGSTFAYLSDKTSTLTNTFTVGAGIEIDLTEDDITSNDSKKRISSGEQDASQNYGKFLPGDSETKDPTVTVKADSSDCYVFMYVTGVDALAAENFTIDKINDGWTKVYGKDGSKQDGLYVYGTADAYTVVKNSNVDQDLTALFNKVTYATTADGTDDFSDNAIVVQAVAVQQKNVDKDTALDQAKNILKLSDTSASSDEQ